MTSPARGFQAIRARDVLSAAAYAGRRHWQRVLGVALVIFGSTALLETVVDALSHNWTLGWIFVINLVAFGVDLFGEVFFTGVLDRLVIFTLLSLSGPIVNIEGTSAVHALRRSAHLVRRRFLLTVVLVTVPITGADWAASSVQDAVHHLPLVADFCIHAVLATAIAIATGLVQVELAHRFIEVDREARAAS